MHIRLENIKTPDTDECEIDELENYLYENRWKYTLKDGELRVPIDNTDRCDIEELSDYLSSENWKWIIDEGQ